MNFSDVADDGRDPLNSICNLGIILIEILPEALFNLAGQWRPRAARFTLTVSKPSVPQPDAPTNEDRAPQVATSHAVSPSTGRSSVVKVILWLLLGIVVVFGWYYRDRWISTVSAQLGLAGKPAEYMPTRVIPVVTATVQKKNMEVFINGLGTVTAFKTVTVRSRVEGELVKVHFTEGQMVKEGDLIAEIDRRQYDVQLQQATGQLERDQATLKSAEFTLKRYLELLESKSITAQQLDEQRALVQQTSGAIQSDQANIANAKLQLDFCHIVAPISGRIGLRLVDQGNIIRANDPTGLAVITQLQPIALVFTIPQDDISRVQKAFTEDPELPVTAWDRDFKTKLEMGKLLAIDNQVDSTTGTVRLKAVFNNEDNLLFPNQFVNVRLLVDIKREAIVVPNAAIQRGPASPFVYVVQKGPSKDDPEKIVEEVELRYITVGITEGAETAVLTGLTPGEIVVTDGLDKLQKGAMVTTAPKEKSEKDQVKKLGEAEKASGGEKKSDATHGTSKKKAP